MKKNKGITLVALVVTIVVLLILAGVSINLVLGNNGIIARAKDAADPKLRRIKKSPRENHLSYFLYLCPDRFSQKPGVQNAKI